MLIARKTHRETTSISSCNPHLSLKNWCHKRFLTHSMGTTGPRTRSYQAKPQVKKFRTSGCLRYAELCIIFGTSVATSTLHRTPIEPPPTSDDEECLDAEMRLRGLTLGTQAGGNFVYDGPM